MRGKKRPLWERMNDRKYDGIWDVIVLPAVIILVAVDVVLWTKDRRASSQNAQTGRP